MKHFSVVLMGRRRRKDNRGDESDSSSSAAYMVVVVHGSSVHEKNIGKARKEHDVRSGIQVMLDE